MRHTAAAKRNGEAQHSRVQQSSEAQQNTANSSSQAGQHSTPAEWQIEKTQHHTVTKENQEINDQPSECDQATIGSTEGGSSGEQQWQDLQQRERHGRQQW